MEEPREEIEAAIFGAVLIDNSLIDYVMCETNGSCYMYYADVFSAMSSMYMDNLHVDVKSLFASGVSKDRIGKVINSTSTSAYIKSHIKQLLDYDFADRSVAYANKILAAKSTKDRISVIAEVPQYINSASKHEDTRTMTQQVLTQIATRAKSKDDIKGIRTHFPTLDNMTGGLFKGGVTVIDADTNIGKSLFLERLILNVARSGERVDYFAYEMSNAQCIERMLSMSAGIEIDAINRPKKSWSARHTALAKEFYNSQEIQNTHFYADELYDFTFDELKAKVNRTTLKTGRKPKLIAVDYVELMTGEGKDDTEIVKNNFESLMKFAKQLKDTNIVMILSRNKNGQTSGSNKLGYHAHMHLKFETDEEFTDLVKATVKKNRDGGKGDFKLVIDRRYLNFKEADISDVRY